MTTNKGLVFNDDIQCEQEEATATTPPVANMSGVGAPPSISMDALTALIASLASSVKDIKGSVDSMQTQFQEQSTKTAALTDNAAQAHEVRTASDSSSIMSTATHGTSL